MINIINLLHRTQYPDLMLIGTGISRYLKWKILEQNTTLAAQDSIVQIGGVLFIPQIHRTKISWNCILMPLILWKLTPHFTENLRWKLCRNGWMKRPMPSNSSLKSQKQFLIRNHLKIKRRHWGILPWHSILSWRETGRISFSVSTLVSTYTSKYEMAYRQSDWWPSDCGRISSSLLVKWCHF